VGVGVVALGDFARAGQGGIQIEGRLEVFLPEPPVIGRRNFCSVSLTARLALCPRPQWLAVLKSWCRRDSSFISYAVPLPLAILSRVSHISVVPTRHGVQKPQLSCWKKCMKLRDTSNMSRLLPNTMNAPEVETSSKAIFRPNSCCARQVPDAPPACTATVLRAPQSSRIWAIRTPKGYS